MSETHRYRPRFRTRGRRRAAKTSARLRTMTPPAPAFARYTATFRPVPVADGKTTLSIPSEIQMAANSCETEYPGPRRQSRTTFCKLRWKRRGKIKISVRRHREDIGHPWVLPDTDLASATQSTLAARHFTQRGLRFKARIHSSHAYRHKAAAVQPSPFATDNIVRMKIPECYGPEEIALERSGSRDQYPELLARSAS